MKLHKILVWGCFSSRGQISNRVCFENFWSRMCTILVFESPTLTFSHVNDNIFQNATPRMLNLNFNYEFLYASFKGNECQWKPTESNFSQYDQFSIHVTIFDNHMCWGHDEQCSVLLFTSKNEIDWFRREIREM